MSKHGTFIETVLDYDTWSAVGLAGFMTLVVTAAAVTGALAAIGLFAAVMALFRVTGI